MSEHLACGQFTQLACCRHAGHDFAGRQGAHRYVQARMGEPAFRARLERYRQALSEADANPHSLSVQVHDINCAWVLTRLKRVFDQAMTVAAVGIDPDGREVFLKSPDHRVAVQALREIARVLRLDEEPVEEPDDDLGRAIADLRAVQRVA